MADQHDIAVDATHHMSKGAADPGNASRGRGASAMKDATRLTYTLTMMSPEEANLFGVDEAERVRLIRVDSAKVNLVPRATVARWFRLVDVVLGNENGEYPSGDHVQTVEPWTPPDLWRNLSVQTIDRILDDIGAGPSEGILYSAAPAAKERAAWSVVVKHCPALTEGQAREVINKWVRTGLLIKEDYEDAAARKTRKGLRVDNGKRPGTSV